MSNNNTGIFNYNEDDAMNQAYVERVLAQGQKSGKRASDQAIPGGDPSAHQGSLQAQGYTPGSHLRHQSIDFLHDFKEMT